ncbi:MAG: hypothetical protein AB7S26_09845 [Sandaracinaceae bacterium]
MSSIGRFFRPKRLLLPGAILLVALLVIAQITVDFLLWDRVRIGAPILVVFLVLGALASLAWVFPNGCKRCGQLLTTRVGVYRPELYDALAQAVAQPTPQAVQQLAPHRTLEALPRRALVTLEHCPECRAVGVAFVAEETHKDYWHTERTSPHMELAGPTVEGIAQLCG